MELNEISTLDREGKMLMAAIMIFSTSPHLMVLGKKVKGHRKTPDEIVELIEKTVEHFKIQSLPGKTPAEIQIQTL